MNTQKIARSGFRNVRICLDCKQEIVGDTCGCKETTPFVNGALVTICASSTGEVPAFLATVGRPGNGAFRLSGTSKWYLYSGAPLEKTGAYGWCRPRRDGDEEFLVKQETERKRAKDLDSAKKDLAFWQDKAKTKRDQARASESEAKKCQRVADGIDPKAEGEHARVRAEARARENIALYLRDVESYRKTAENYLQEAAEYDSRADASRARIEALSNSSS